MAYGWHNIQIKAKSELPGITWAKYRKKKRNLDSMFV